jgi:hypothetical protein
MFDASSRQACRVRLTTTSTPLHALTTLNDPTWVEAARVLAERAIQGTVDRDGRLSYAFRQVVGRPPGERDLAALRRAYEKQAAIYSADAAAAKMFIHVGKAPRDESLDRREHAALSAMCLAIMNLDEALTRE